MTYTLQLSLYAVVFSSYAVHSSLHRVRKRPHYSRHSPVLKKSAGRNMDEYIFLCVKLILRNA